MRLHSLLVIAVTVLLLASCAGPVVTPTATVTIAPTPTSNVDPCLTTAKTYKPGMLPPGRIAFICFLDANQTINVYVFDTTTGQISNLTKHSSLNDGIHWSPDGKRIAFVRDDRLFIMNADDKQQVHPADGLASIYQMAWSPDAKKLAFAAKPNGIHVINADGSHDIVLTDYLTL